MRSWWMLVIVAIAVVLGLSLSGDANASSYAYARQELTNFTITVTGTTLTGVSVATSTTNNANLTGEPSDSQTNATDALEAYVDKPLGSTTKPAENFFPAKGATGPSWVRADTLLGAIPSLPTAGGASTTLGIMRNTAEGYLAGGAGNATSSAVYNVAYTFTATSNGTIQLKTDWSNEAHASLMLSTPGDSASAAFNFQASLQCTGCEPTQLLFIDFMAFSAPLMGNVSKTTDGTSNLGPVSGMNLLSFPGSLAAGTTYTLTYNGTETVTLTNQPQTVSTPEPTTMLLLGTGLLGLVGYCWRRRHYGSAPTSAGASN